MNSNFPLKLLKVKKFGQAINKGARHSILLFTMAKVTASLDYSKTQMFSYVCVAHHKAESEGRKKEEIVNIRENLMCRREDE